MIGIAGVGMSGLAQLLHHRGVKVTGSDSHDGFPTLDAIRALGISYITPYAKENVPEGVDMVVYTDAITADNPERLIARERGIPEYSYFEALGMISKDAYTVVVSGTHGKTTTTGMLTKILVDAGFSPTAIIGSILKDFGSNCVMGEKQLFIVEGCEWKGHFLHLDADVFVITNIEFDHSDYFKNLEAVQNLFIQGIQKLPKHGVVILNTNDLGTKPVIIQIENQRKKERKGKKIIDYTKTDLLDTPFTGFNRENAQAATTAAMVCAEYLGRELSIDSVTTSLWKYQGAWRRFEYRGKTKKGAEVYDDYAHHPTAVKKTIAMARERFPEKNIAVLFHPHLYSRTQSLFHEFAEALSTADSVYILPIYPARESAENFPGVNSKALTKAVQDIAGNATYIDTFEKAERLLEKLDLKYLIITMGAGDVFHVADSLTR